MQISILLAHPDKNSFNHAIAKTARQVLRRLGYQVIYHDLYAEGFDPVFTKMELSEKGPLASGIKTHCEEISRADGIIVVHPNWWGQPPAVLKGWVDRVLRAGVAYRFNEGDGGEGVPVGLLRAKIAMIFNTSNTPIQREKNVFGDPLEQLWKYCIFHFCGVRHIFRKSYGVIVTSTPAERKRWLEDVGRNITEQFPPVKSNKKRQPRR